MDRTILHVAEYCQNCDHVGYGVLLQDFRVEVGHVQLRQACLLDVVLYFWLSYLVAHQVLYQSYHGLQLIGKVVCYFFGSGSRGV